MKGGRRPACTPLSLAGNNGERSGSGRQENDAEVTAGGKRSSKDGQRKPEQHETEGPRRPRRGQRAGLNRVKVKDGVTEIAAERVQRGLTESTACESGPAVQLAGATQQHCQERHRAVAAELVLDVARRGLSTRQQGASTMRESKERGRRQIGQQGRAQMERCSGQPLGTAGSQRAERSGWSRAWLVALGGVSTPFT